MLVNVECAVHLPVHLRADPSEPDALRRPSQDRQDPAEGAATNSVHALLAGISSESERRASDWVHRDRVLILTSLHAGLRADELLRANIGDVRRSDDGAVIHARGKGGKDRRIPVEPALVVPQPRLGERAP